MGRIQHFNGCSRRHTQDDNLIERDSRGEVEQYNLQLRTQVAQHRQTISRYTVQSKPSYNTGQLHRHAIETGPKRISYLSLLFLLSYVQ